MTLMDKRNALRFAAVLPLVALAACSKIPLIGGGSNEETGEAPGSTGLVGKDLVSADSLPQGTITWRDGSYMIPIGTLDSDGCQAYRHWAPERVTPQVIYYRKGNGDFTANKVEALCDGPD